VVQRDSATEPSARLGELELVASGADEPFVVVGPAVLPARRRVPGGAVGRVLAQVRPRLGDERRAQLGGDRIAAHDKTVAVPALHLGGREHRHRRTRDSIQVGGGR
jgi:hypothetical protein